MSIRSFLTAAAVATALAIVSIPAKAAMFAPVDAGGQVSAGATALVSEAGFRGRGGRSFHRGGFGGRSFKPHRGHRWDKAKNDRHWKYSKRARCHELQARGFRIRCN